MARESTESQQKRAVNNLREQDKSQPYSLDCFASWQSVNFSWLGISDTSRPKE